MGWQQGCCFAEHCFLVEPTRADSSHVGTVIDIEYTLAVRAFPHARANSDRDNDAQMGSSSAIS